MPNLLDNLLAPLGGLGTGSGVTYTPDGQVDSILVDLGLVRGQVDYMDTEPTPAPVILGGAVGTIPLLDGLGGRSIESIDVDGPLDLSLDALFSTNQSQNTESTAVVGGDLLSTALLHGLSSSSLESLGATGPLGIDLDLDMENGTGSALTSLVSVFDGNLVAGNLLDGPGGRIDSLTLDGPLAVILGTGDGGDTGFPLVIGDNSLIGASLLDNLSNSSLEAFDIGLGSFFGGGGDLLGLGADPLDGLLSGLLS